MSRFKLLLEICFILAVNFIIQGSTLGTEGLFSSYESPPGTFTYQVGVIGRKNNSNERQLVCDGGIIAPDLIMTAAECFINNEGFYRELTFSILSDYSNKDIMNGFEILIDLIYLLHEGPFVNHNFAVAKLVEAFDFALYPYLSVLEIPTMTERFWEQKGQVAGHGYHIHDGSINLNEEVCDSDVYTDYQLRNATVQIMTDPECIPENGELDQVWQFCGFMYPTREDGRAGICKLDVGAPLVINNKVVGVASTPTINCDSKSPYARVSTYWPFINGIKKGLFMAGTITYPNRKHILL